MKQKINPLDFFSVGKALFSQAALVTVGVSLTTSLLALSFDRWINPQESLVQADLVAVIQSEIAILAESESTRRPADIEAVRRSVELVVSNFAYQEGVIIIASQAIVAGGNDVPDVTDRIQQRVKEYLNRGQ